MSADKMSNFRRIFCTGGRDEETDETLNQCLFVSTGPEEKKLKSKKEKMKERRERWLHSEFNTRGHVCSF